MTKIPHGLKTYLYQMYEQIQHHSSPLFTTVLFSPHSHLCFFLSFFLSSISNKIILPGCKREKERNRRSCSSSSSIALQRRQRLIGPTCAVETNKYHSPMMSAADVSPLVSLSWSEVEVSAVLVGLVSANAFEARVFPSLDEKLPHRKAVKNSIKAIQVREVFFLSFIRMTI